MPSDEKSSRNSMIDTMTLIYGFILGFVIGGLITLFNAPRRGDETRSQITGVTETVRKRVETVISADPVEDSLAAGKAAARRRREELGIGEE